MTATTFGWLVLLCPLVGTVGIGLGFRRLSGRLPGWIATGSLTEDELREGEVTPMRRSGTPEEIAWPVAWLCSPGASSITGQCISISGGEVM